MPIVSVPKNEALRLTPEADHIRDKAVGAYLGLAIGDALGATVEFMTPREIGVQYGVHNAIVGGGWLSLKAGQVTDDTEMSLALGDSILQRGEILAESVAQAFSDWMRSKPVDIGHTVRRGISRFRRTGESAVPYDEHGAGNGACMRCLPIALATFGAPASVVEQAVKRQAHVTHCNRLSDAGTLVVVQLVQDGLQGRGIDQLQQRIDQFVAVYPEFAFRDRRRTENPSGFIVDTLQAVFQALLDTEDFESALIDVVNRGGDADTTGAILGMIAGALWGADQIPGAWLKKLAPAVRLRCAQQAGALIELSRPQPVRNA